MDWIKIDIQQPKVGSKIWVLHKGITLSGIVTKSDNGDYYIHDVLKSVKVKKWATWEVIY